MPGKVGASIARDVVDIITVFSARLYGWRSPKNQTLLDGIAKAVDAGQLRDFLVEEGART